VVEAWFLLIVTKANFKMQMLKKIAVNGEFVALFCQNLRMNISRGKHFTGKYDRRYRS
jgi:hypothetical protein